MAEQKTVALTPEQIDSIKKEATDFEQKSIDLALSSPALSAHYWRLFTACKPSLKRLGRMELTQRNKSAAEKRKNAKAGTSTSTSTPRSNKP